MARRRLTLVGTYTGSKSRGIYAFWLETDTGRMEPLGLMAEAQNPSYLALHPAEDVLYAVSELSTSGGEDGGRLLAFRLDKKSGRLEFLGEQPTGGGSPCHLSVDGRGRFLFVSNYSGGSIAVFPLRDDGSPDPMVQLIRHSGSGPNHARQEKPHPHSVWVDARDRFLFAPDLGIDRVVIYRLDHEQGLLVDHASATMAAGAGPRHLAFHPSGRFAYVINELDSTIAAMMCDAEQGNLTPLHTLSTLPDGFTGDNGCAHVAVHPSGRFLYGSNRGHDSIAMYAIDEATGRLTFLGCEPTGGKTPRHFTLDPSGGLLLAANQETDTVIAFFIDPATGRLRPAGHKIELPTPVCVLIV